MYGCWRCMEASCKWPTWSWLVFLAVMIVVAYLLRPRPRGDGLEVVRVYKRSWWPHPYAREAGLLWRKVVTGYRYYHNGKEME